MIDIKQLYKPIAFRKSIRVHSSYHKWGYEISIGNIKNRRRNSDYIHVRKDRATFIALEANYEH
ncbi:MAG: hypothetical protein ACP5OH_06780 [Nitrososphaerota archaeon]